MFELGYYSYYSILLLLLLLSYYHLPPTILIITQKQIYHFIRPTSLPPSLRWECVPLNSPCCPYPGNYSSQYNLYTEIPPCVYAPRGLQADSFIYAMVAPHYKAYVLTIPLIANGLGGNQSTFHQRHVESVRRKKVI